MWVGGKGGKFVNSRLHECNLVLLSVRRNNDGIPVWENRFWL